LEKPLRHKPPVLLAPDGARLPTVAAVIGCYNQAAFIEEAIHSVAAQTYPEFTCVVVDDCSTDDSAQRIEACLAELEDNRFRFVRQDRNRGQMDTMLAGLDASESQFVAFLDGDDAWEPDFLDNHIRAHLDPAGAAAVSCSFMAIVDEQSRIVAGAQSNFRAGDPRQHDTPARTLTVVDDDPTLVFVGRGGTGWIWSTTSAMVFRRDAVDVIRPASGEAIRISADAYLAPAAHIVGGTVRLEKCLGRYRIHRDNGWAHGRLLGDGQPMGRIDAQREKAVRRALMAHFCASAARLEALVPEQELRAILLAQFGWREIFECADSDPAVRQFFGAWITPMRRLALRLSPLMPGFLRRTRIKRWLS
jgi:glycosyltransferase involved in cell wall biosynthesis